MALNFPDNPTLNQIYTDLISGFSYQWNGLVWISYAPAGTIADGTITPAKLSTGKPVWNTGGGLVVTGVTTASSFVGNLTGTATTATNLANAANITTGTINSARLTGTYGISVTGTAAGLSGTPNLNVGIVTALSFVVSAGTSSQFLKGNGSLDSSSYTTTGKAIAMSMIFGS